MTHWPIVTLSELCEVNIGRTPARNRSEFWGPGHPWLAIADMNQGRDIANTKESITDLAVQQCNCKPVPPGTVLLSFKLSVGKVAIARVPLYTNEAIASLPVRRPETVRPDYLAWALSSINLTAGLDRAAKGLTLNKPKLLSLRVPLPPLSEQRRIAAILDKADALRSKRAEAVSKLLELQRSVFARDFGDLSRFIVDRSARVADLLVEPMRNGTSPSANGTKRAAVLTLPAITGERFDGRATKIAYFEEPRIASSRVREGLFLVCRGNGSRSLVGVGQFAPAMPDTLYPDTIIALRLDTNRIDKLFLSFMWREQVVRRQIEAGARTTNGTWKINQAVLERLAIPLPPIEDQRRFARQSKAVAKLEDRHASGLRLLDVLFAALQHRAFRGEP